MKRLFALLLALMMVLTLVACDSGRRSRRSRKDKDSTTDATSATGEVITPEGTDNTDVITPEVSVPVVRPLPGATQPTETLPPVTESPTPTYTEPTEPPVVDVPGTAVNGKYAYDYGPFADTKTFTCQEMSITLPKAFYESAIQGYTQVYDSSKAAVFVLREAFGVSGIDGNWSVKEYADLVVKANSGNTYDPIEVNGDYAATKYTGSNNMEYCCLMYKGGNAFWLLQFVCYSEDYEEMVEYFGDWVDTLSFSA